MLGNDDRSRDTVSCEDDGLGESEQDHHICKLRSLKHCPIAGSIMLMPRG